LLPLPDDPLPLPPDDDAVASAPPPFPPLPKPFGGGAVLEPHAAAVTIDATPTAAASETRRNETEDTCVMGISERWRLMWGGV
jgi:hypothetical protein